VSRDYLFDRSGPPDPDVVELERLLGPLGLADPPPFRFGTPEPRRARSRVFPLVFAVAAAAIVALVSLTWFHRLDRPEGWEVTRVSGAPLVGTQAMTDRATLRAGASIETRESGRVTVAVGDVGQVQLEPESTLRLLSTRPGDYRLHLARGTMHAIIWSPPGQFFVETPSSTAVDLGCAYTLTVGRGGEGMVRVTSGWVGFEWQGREAFIPAGAVCATRPRLGPGTPHFEDTSEAFNAALEVIDTQAGTAAGRSAAVARVLTEARPRDTVTLWHLLSRVGAGDRDAVFDRLAALAPPPSGVTREGIRAGDREMLDRWWDQLGLGSTNWWRVWKQPWRENGGR
jgi:FecR protein